MQKSSFKIEELASKIKCGEVAIFPTDTLPAIGAIPYSANQIWEIKKRPLNKPLILMSATPEELFKFVQPSALQSAGKIAEKYWPGALTLVLPVLEEFSNETLGGENTIGLRVPDCSITRDLLQITGPLATTSANLSGEEPVKNALEAKRHFPNIPLLGPLPWPKPSGVASTVISWQASGEWKILRKGSLTLCFT